MTVVCRWITCWMLLFSTLPRDVMNVPLRHGPRVAMVLDSQSLLCWERTLFLTKQLGWRFGAFLMRSVSVTVPSEPAGPGPGVGGGGGGRGCVWHHAAQGTRRAGLRFSGALRSLHPVPHRQGSSAEGRHPGAPGHPPAGAGAAGARLCSCLPCDLQSFHHQQHPHGAAVPEVRVSMHDTNICHMGASTSLCLRLLLPFVLTLVEFFFFFFF